MLESVGAVGLVGSVDGDLKSAVGVVYGVSCLTVSRSRFFGRARKGREVLLDFSFLVFDLSNFFRFRT